MSRGKLEVGLGGWKAQHFAVFVAFPIDDEICCEILGFR
jgi:hypothetical protein